VTPRSRSRRGEARKSEEKQRRNKEETTGKTPSKVVKKKTGNSPYTNRTQTTNVEERRKQKYKHFTKERNCPVHTNM
jgi:hypothetical protein